MIDFLLFSALSCAALSVDLKYDAARLADWTTTLRATQPEDPFAAVYRVGNLTLIFVAAHHTTDARSLTYRLIDQAFENFDIDTLIVEGTRYSLGENPQSLLAYVAKHQEKDGFQRGGETVHAVKGAKRENAKIWGGEPDETDIRLIARDSGITEEDLLGFYVLQIYELVFLYCYPIDESRGQFLKKRQIFHPSKKQLIVIACCFL